MREPFKMGNIRRAHLKLYQERYWRFSLRWSECTVFASLLNYILFYEVSIIYLFSYCIFTLTILVFIFVFIFFFYTTRINLWKELNYFLRFNIFPLFHPFKCLLNGYFVPKRKPSVWKKAAVLDGVLAATEFLGTIARTRIQVLVSTLLNTIQNPNTDTDLPSNKTEN